MTLQMSTNVLLNSDMVLNSESAAEYIFFQSTRRSGPFQKINSVNNYGEVFQLELNIEMLKSNKSSITTGLLLFN